MSAWLSVCYSFLACVDSSSVATVCITLALIDLGHVHVAPVAGKSCLALLDAHGCDEAKAGCCVREDSHDTLAALQHLIEPLQAVGGENPLVMSLRKRVTRQGVLNRLIQPVSRVRV